MSETKTDTNLQFPEVGPDGEVAPEFWQEYKLLQELWQKPEGVHQVEVKLPQVVGYVPQEERDAFDTLDAPMFGLKNFTTLDRYQLGVAFPGILGFVKQDLKRLGVNAEQGSYGIEAQFRHGLTEANNFADNGYFEGTNIARPHGNWHLDNPSHAFRDGENGIEWLGDPTSLFYVVRSKYPPLFYEGTVPIKTSTFSPDDVHKKIFAELTSLDIPDEGQVLPAPEYAIVRMSPISPHSRAVFPEDAYSTFARVSVNPDRNIWDLVPDHYN